MSVESFTVTYDGPEVVSGAINVFELAPALTAIGELVRDANRFLNGEQAKVDVRVESDFAKGSFGIHLLLDQQSIETARQTLGFVDFTSAKDLVDALFGAALAHKDTLVEIAVAGLLGLYKVLKGERAKPGQIVIKDNHGTIQVGERSIVVDARAIELYRNDAIRADVDQVARSVAREGIDKLDVEKEGNLLERLTKEDVPARIRQLETDQESIDHVLTDVREALVKVVTANFEKGKWKFSDGESKFNAEIADPV